MKIEESYYSTIQSCPRSLLQVDFIIRETSAILNYSMRPYCILGLLGHPVFSLLRYKKDRNKNTSANQ